MAKGADLLFEFRICSLTEFLNLTDAEFEFPEGVGYGFHESFDGCLALLDLTLGLLGLGGEG